MYQTPSRTPSRPRRRRRLLAGAGAALALLAVLALALAVGAGLVLSGRPVQLVVLGAGFAVAAAGGWPASGHAALAGGAAYLIVETVQGRLDAEHAPAQAALTAGVLAAILAGGWVRRRAPASPRPRRERRLPADPIAAWVEPPEGMGAALLEHGTLAYELERARRHQRPLSLLAVRPDEIDVLAAAGAEGLARMLDLIGDAVETTVRSIDIVERRGESRFEVVLPETTADGARTVAERVRLRIDASRPEPEPGRPLGLSVSVGVACYPADGGSAEELAEAAERALARAVELGGNRTVLHSLPAGAPRGWALSAAERHLLSVPGLPREDGG